MATFTDQIAGVSDPVFPIVATPAEVAAGVAPTDFRYAELHLLRYGINTTPGVTDLSTALASALSVASELGGADVTLPSEQVAYDGTIEFPRYTGLRGTEYGSRLVPLSASGRLQLDSNCRLERLDIAAAATVAGSIGVQLGRAANFEAFCTLKHVRIRNFEQCILLENSYYCELYDVDCDGGTYGITINPTAGGGGFVSTLSFRKVIVHNMQRQGIRDLSAVQSQACSLRDVVVEACGQEDTGTYPQVQLVAAQGLVWDGGYIEYAPALGTPPTALKCVSGTFRNLFVNECNIGIDCGSGAANVTIENAVITNADSYSVQATGGANANLVLRRVSLGAAVNIAANTVVYDNCSGVGLPSNVDANSLELTGTKPRFGIGGIASSKIHSIRYYTFTEDRTVAANSVTEGVQQTVGSGLVTPPCVVIAYPTAALPAGIMAGTPRRVSDNGFVIPYVNPTDTPQAVANTFHCAIVRFAT